MSAAAVADESAVGIVAGESAGAAGAVVVFVVG